MFDAALLESRKGRRLGDRKKSLPIAIALHAATIAAFVGATMWNAGEPPDPVIPVAFPVPAPPPPPLGTGGSHTPPTRRGANPHSVFAPLAPTLHVLPVVTEPRSASPEPAFVESDQEGPPGDPSGERDGPGHLPVVGSGTVAGDRPIPVGGDVKEPILLVRIDPAYPDSMRIGRKQGVVILEAVITATGEVDDVRVLKSEGAVLDRAASDAVRRWRYRPATLNGRAVSVYLTVTVRFGLRF